MSRRVSSFLERRNLKRIACLGGRWLPERSRRLRTRVPPGGSIDFKMNADVSHRLRNVERRLPTQSGHGGLPFESPRSFQNVRAGYIGRVHPIAKWLLTLLPEF